MQDNRKPTKDRAIVKPVKSAEFTFKQSRFEQMPKLPSRILCSGRSQSRKGCCLSCAVLDHYRGCFKKIVILSRTAKIDPTYEGIIEYAEGRGQDNRSDPFIFTHFADEELSKIVKDWSTIVAREKKERKEDKSKAPLSSMLVIIDDMSDDEGLRRRGTSILSQLFYSGRHVGISTWLNVRDLVSAGTMLRRNASALVIFKLTSGSAYEKLRDEYGKILGSKETFDEVYNEAVGKHAPPYSFLVIFPHEQRVDRLFLARWDMLLIPDDSSDEDTRGLR